jgi:hypothetical protein
LRAYCSFCTLIRPPRCAFGGSNVYLADTRYVSDARRFDMGERDHFVSLGMASASMELMVEWGAGAVVQRLAMLTERIEDGVRGIGIEVPERRMRAPYIS